MKGSSVGRPITFVVPGQRISAATREGRAAAGAPDGLRQGRLKEAIRVGAHRGSGSTDLRIDAVPGEDVVVLRIANGPALMLHPETARDLLNAQIVPPGTTRGVREDDPLTCAVPSRLGWRLTDGPATQATRGLVGDVLLAGLDVVTDLFEEKAEDFVASQIVRRVDGQVRAGVHRLQQDGIGDLTRRVPEATLPESAAPVLVFVHGTFSSTQGTFADLWTQHPRHVRTLFDTYGGRVVALEHPTLGASPVANAIALARAMAPKARLHLVTHSRGGLVAEALARVCADPDAALGSLGRAADATLRRELETLAAIVKQKRLSVDRIVRVACPARGTLLASNRLDAYLSVFRWTLQLAGVPVFPGLVDFLGEVAKRRADPTKLPGLAAQIPDSPLIRWLNAGDARVPGDLRVVAGDLQGDSVTSWLKTLLADSFYWTDNDLVVQTRSMYGGAPRQAAQANAPRALFVLDQGGSVSHFNYFANARTADAIVAALVEDAPRDFREIGPLSWAGTSSDGLRAKRVAAGPDRPAVFVLPGILGSHLKVGAQRVWLSWHLLGGFERLKYSGGPGKVTPDGPIGFYYDALVQFLSETHEVIEFPFDWRLPMEEEAARLAKDVTTAVAARVRTRQPVRLLAHSMGGLVARTMQIVKPAAWDAMMAVDGARVVMLGTPNLGSWAPMQVLSGDDTFGNLLTAVGAPFQTQAARNLMAELPGFLQLQAGLLDTTKRLGRHSTWAELAEADLDAVRRRSGWHTLPLQLDSYRWGVPSQDVLDAAVGLRKRLDMQDLTPFERKMALVVGRSLRTPVGFAVDDGALTYLDAVDDGDGRVPTDSAVLRGIPAFRVDAGHSDLPGTKEAFRAYLDLLEKGTTALLPRLRAGAPSRAAGGAAAGRITSRPSRTAPSSEPPTDARDFRTPAPGPARPSAVQTVLRVTVVNGDLKFVGEPLLLGHYRSSMLTGTEYVMDRLIAGAMQASLTAGLYPDRPGSHQVFVNSNADRENPWRFPRPEAVIVAGLGQEGALQPAALVDTVRQAVIAWVQRKTEQQDPSAARGVGVPVVLELAATLLGSGGGIEVARSAQLIAQGVREANERLARSNWPQIGHLRLIELYLSRAGEAWRALRLQAQASAGAYVVTDTVEEGNGALRRPLDDGYRGAAYDQISAVTDTSAHGEAAIAYTVNTKRARSEVTAQTTQVAMISALVANAATDRNHDAEIGRTLFQLLVPTELEPFFSDNTDMLLELDGTTAGIPWELLDTATTSRADDRPWAIRAKLLRKLRTDRYRPQPRDASIAASVLVIGEPKSDPDVYPELPAARAEAVAVYETLTRTDKGWAPMDPVALIRSDEPGDDGPDARSVVRTLLQRDWRIVHIAGHGELPETLEANAGEGSEGRSYGNPRGVVLSDGAFLGRNEIKSMRVVPELVFVNCCHLGARADDQLLRPAVDPPRFAASVASALIDIGVRCVIAAGWAVGDVAANAFATTFYSSLRREDRFADAVAHARTAAMKEGGNTWAAYQCYGDPDWRLLGESESATQSIAEEFAAIGSAEGLTIALDTLAVRGRSRNDESSGDRAKREAAHRSLAERLRHLEGRFAASWGDRGRVAEAFGTAWVEADDAARAIDWYDRALRANDGGASFRVFEQRANLRVRSAQSAVPANADANALQAARASILEAIAALTGLRNLQTTMERESLLGSAHKRLAMLATQARDEEAATEAIGQMVVHYAAAERIAKETASPDLFYPAMNRMAAELALHAGKDDWNRLQLADVEAARSSLRARTASDPDFWSIVGETELAFYEALSAGNLAQALNSLREAYDDVARRITSAWRWKSVRDQLEFVLPRYVARASAPEQQAATKLRDHLTRLAAQEEAALARPEPGAAAAARASRRPKKRAPRAKKAPAKRKRPARRVRR
jgi:CHAT domain/Lecithin:cholesterol acyltransferase